MTVTNVVAVRIPPGVKEGITQLANGIGIGCLIALGLFVAFLLVGLVWYLWARWQDARDAKERVRKVEEDRALSMKVHQEGRQAFRDGKPCQCPYTDWERKRPWEGGWTQERQKVGR